jgi:hypothetical protein
MSRPARRMMTAPAGSTPMTAVTVITMATTLVSMAPRGPVHSARRPSVLAVVAVRRSVAATGQLSGPGNEGAVWRTSMPVWFMRAGEGRSSRPSSGPPTPTRWFMRASAPLAAELGPGVARGDSVEDNGLPRSRMSNRRCCGRNVTPWRTVP